MPLTVADSAIHLYADDSSLYKTRKYIQGAQINLQHKWCKRNNMSLNSVNNYIIESVEYQNVLGSIVDKTLSWSFHVKRICSNLHLKLHLFANKTCFLNLDTNPSALNLGSQMALYKSPLTCYFFNTMFHL